MGKTRKSDAGAWSRASIQRDRERFERQHAEPFAGDPFPPGLTPEEIGGELVAVDDDREPTLDGWF